jgi:uncharacterized membrane protein YkgB
VLINVLVAYYFWYNYDIKVIDRIVKWNIWWGWMFQYNQTVKKSHEYQQSKLKKHQ